MNETDFSYYKIHWRKGIPGLKFQFIFKFSLKLIFAAQILFFVPKYVTIMLKYVQ